MSRVEVTSATLRRVLSMPAEAMAEALLFLAEQLEADEARRDKQAERKRQWRDKHGTIEGQSQDNDGTRARDVEINNKLSQESNIKLLPLSPSRATFEPPEFQDFWKVYPPRLGARDRKAAVKAFRAALKRATAEEILAGARGYAAEMHAKGKINTEYVRQARTWLNADGWKEYDQESVKTNGIDRLTPAERELYERHAVKG
jgi:hypothetical protein